MAYPPLPCFMVRRRPDLPLQWHKLGKDSERVECAENDPERWIGTPRYERLDTGEISVGTPPGSLYFVEDNRNYGKGPDGRSLVCIVPTGEDWYVDGPAANGPGWTRTGEPPLVTVTPSIQTPNYHGFLTGGVLREC